jgi:hypothetical protein
VPNKAKIDDERTYSLRPRYDGNVVLSISKKAKDKPADFPRFTKVPKGWERVITDAIETSDKQQESEELWSELDNKFRALKSSVESGDQGFEGWVLRDADEAWISHPRENLKSFLMAQGFEKVDPVLGSAIFKSWTLINEPFQTEYPGGRMWNRNAAQLTFSPLELSQGEVPYHPHWDRIMNHCGSDLDEYIADLPWTGEWGIVRGGDYLKAWVACMLRSPYRKLPYLFMYGPQNSGKSVFHEALSLLMTKGVAKADKALTSDQGYNGELQGAVLAVVDEVDISKSGMVAYNRLKEWTTGLTVAIHAKYRQVYEVISTLHFVQMANTRKALPVFPGDQRITAISVQSPEKDIPKEKLLAELRKEGPAFMRTLVDMDIPDAIGRLMLPVIETRGKAEAVISNMDCMERFMDDRCYRINGACILLKDFKDKLWAGLEKIQRDEYNTLHIKNQLSEVGLPVGRLRNNSEYVGNISFVECEVSEPFIVQGKRLIREKAND